MNILEELKQVAETRKVIAELPDDTMVDPNYASVILKALGRPYTPLTLRKIRCISSTGPRFHKAPNGRVRYSLADLKEFASASM